jgi:hypothetical protein
VDQIGRKIGGADIVDVADDMERRDRFRPIRRNFCDCGLRDAEHRYKKEQNALHDASIF